ncbi:interferon-induced protein with tetratricopeptide repeats 5-like [Amphiura filiformis]|uniref:interferon-induced protein with tetratricopeptide repeats 5-like n=1 Tax=Amphiura filiformis TaxID=82378 RepID=UPI003B2193F4
MALPDFLTDAPSHFNWGIDIGTFKEFNPLKLELEEHLEYNPGVMTIPALLFQSFIFVSKYKDPKPDYSKGREYLNKAYDEIKGVPNEEEKQGYLIVAKCNEAIMAHKLGEPTTSLEAEIQKLLSGKTDLSQACIDSVRACALSRVGMSKYDEAKNYFHEALKVQPDNIEWLFGLALVIGRHSGRRDGQDYNDDKEQARQLYEKILSLDNKHALAHVFLAHNLTLKEEHDAAMSHANKALQLKPDHPKVLERASKVFRNAGHLENALLRLQTYCSTVQDDCASCQNSILFHELGVVYRNMYNDQNAKKKEAIQQRRRFNPPDKNLLHKAIDNFTKAIEADPTNIMARLDRARTYERLQMMSEADNDFRSILGTKNNEYIDQVHSNISYILFLQHRKRHDEACDRFKHTIDLAVMHCTICPLTPENPRPKFYGTMRRGLDTAKNGYVKAMEEKVTSHDPETRSQGLKGLAWLYQVYGEHDSARAKYEEYLDCDENRNDSEAIHSLVKTLIQLGDFEEARRRIEELKGLQELDLAQQLTIECASVQGEGI